MSNKIYNTFIPSNNCILSVNEYNKGKIEDIHNQLYIQALELYLKDHPEMNGWSFKEIKPSNWKDAPYVICTSSKYPFIHKKIHLNKYWKNLDFLQEKCSSSDDIIIDDENYNDAEVVNINYVKGKVKMRTKILQNEYEVPFSKLNENTIISDDDCTLKGTFVDMTNNISDQ